ncbi:unnamed protein product [Nesidiocoris tenuis]|uniref:Cytochrome b561 domain-containing protein n=1 Tax=Nesidiocoris tenuis TaxID=355587 RepID=A0A6H5GB70_9HEMI|nr:unnamed protein product [Nesidiocoris tenuis]
MLEPPLLITFAVAQVLGLVAVVFVIMAVVHENDQVTVLTPQAAQNFIWHPLLMTLGMIYLFGCLALRYLQTKASSTTKCRLFSTFSTPWSSSTWLPSKSTNGLRISRIGTRVDPVTLTLAGKGAASTHRVADAFPCAGSRKNNGGKTIIII